MPAPLSSVNTAFVATLSTQLVCPPGTRLGSQQLTGATQGVPLERMYPSKFNSHNEASQLAFGLQFGAPSVAKITAVFPGNAFKIGLRLVSVALSGVPPFGVWLSADWNLVNTSPIFPLIEQVTESPGCVVKTSLPGSPQLSPGEVSPTGTPTGNMAAPYDTRCPMISSTLTMAFTAAAYFVFTPSRESDMLPEASSTK